MMVFALAACGDNETPSGSGGNTPGTSQSGEENKGSKELYDVTDAQITVADGFDVSIIPAVAKKGVGTLKSGGYDLRKSSLSSYKAVCDVTYFDVTKEGYDALLDYYESNGGTITNTSTLSLSFPTYIPAVREITPVSYWE